MLDISISKRYKIKSKPVPWDECRNVAEKQFSAEYIRSRVHYDPYSGWLYWRVFYGDTIWSEENAGRYLGDPMREDYVNFELDGVKLYAHRVACLIMLGGWPPKVVDHKNRVKNDNRWENIRPATHQQNMQNRKVNRNNKLGFKGVGFDGSRFTASVSINGKRVHLGSFTTAELAATAYDNAIAGVHGAFACTNFAQGLIIENPFEYRDAFKQGTDNNYNEFSRLNCMLGKPLK